MKTLMMLVIFSAVAASAQTNMVQWRAAALALANDPHRQAAKIGEALAWGNTPMSTTNGPTITVTNTAAVPAPVVTLQTNYVAICSALGATPSSIPDGILTNILAKYRLAAQQAGVTNLSKLTNSIALLAQGLEWEATRQRCIESGVLYSNAASYTVTTTIVTSAVAWPVATNTQSFRQTGRLWTGADISP